MRQYAVAALVSLLITGAILTAAAQLVRERSQRHDITMLTAVSLVNVPREERIEEEAERKPPEPPRREPQIDFAPELPTPSLTAPALGGPSVALDPAVFGGVAPTGPMTFEAADLDKAPRAVIQRPPTYPRRAQQRGIRGQVTARFLVQVDGTVAQVSIVSSDPAGVFDRAVIDAVSGWRYEPGQLAGEAVAAWILAPIDFVPDGGR